MRVGVTGHQHLDKSALWEWIEVELEAILRGVSKPLTLVSCLAVGADQLASETARKVGGHLLVVLPFADIRRTFDPAGLRGFERLLKGAKTETISPRDNDEESYLAAGKRVVDLSSLMIAVWDEKPARGLGGTADIVAYSQNKGVEIIILNPYLKQTRKIPRNS